MNLTLIRPSLRKAKFSLMLCTFFLGAVIFFWRSIVPDAHPLILLVGIIPLTAPVLAYLDTLRTSLTIEGPTVRYKHGIFSETVRAMDISRLQNVFVDRTLSQKLWGVGTLILESASENGRIAIADIDRPQQVADMILKLSRAEGSRV